MNESVTPTEPRRGRAWLFLAITATVVATISGLYLSRRPATVAAKNTAERTQATEEEPAQGLVFEREVVNLGSATGPQRVAFRFENRDGAPLTIEKTYTSCSCTVTELAKRTYAAGESGQVEVSLTPKPSNQPGRQILVINVETANAAGRRGSHRLEVHVQHTPDVVVGGPVAMRLAKGTEGVGYFYLTDYRERPLSIRSLRTTSPKFEAEVAETPAKYQSGWKFMFRVRSPRGALDVGQYREAVEVTTDDPARPSLRVEVQIDVTERLRVVPAAARLRPGASSPDLTGRVFIDDTAGEGLEVESVTGLPAPLSYELVRLSPCRTSVVIRCPSGQAPSSDRPIRVTVNLRKPSNMTCAFEVIPWADSSARR